MACFFLLSLSLCLSFSPRPPSPPNRRKCRFFRSLRLRRRLFIIVSSFEPRYFSSLQRSNELSSHDIVIQLFNGEKESKRILVLAFPLAFLLRNSTAILYATNTRQTAQPRNSGDFSGGKKKKKRKNRFRSDYLFSLPPSPLPSPPSFSRTRIYSNFLRAVYTKFPNVIVSRWLLLTTTEFVVFGNLDDARANNFDYTMSSRASRMPLSF